MQKLIQTLYDEISRIRLIDPHSHINPHSPAASTVNDLLGYHYYTELAHSAGLPKPEIEEHLGFEQAERILSTLCHCNNTVQYSWLVELSQTFIGFQSDELTQENLQSLYDGAAEKMSQSDWADQIFEITNLDAIFLTNDFDDPLTGFDTNRYVPCLRTDDLVFNLGETSVRDRLAKAADMEVHDVQSLLDALDKLFRHFTSRGARACAISLPPDFAPQRPGQYEFNEALQAVLKGSTDPVTTRTLGYGVFYALADRCEDYNLPFDLMIGVWRGVYPAGVYQGRDLYDKTTSLYQFRHLFNDKAKVTFPISVLTHNQNQELVSYSWIFPNVVTSGHWWYSNIPAFIEPDLRARLEAVPRNKQIGYYSDAYKLEFVLPKYNMYRRNLATVLAKDFVQARGWSEERAIDLARTVLRDNVESIFPPRG